MLGIGIAFACGAQEPFVHPGGSITRTQLELARRALAADEPQSSAAFARLTADIQIALAEKPSATETFDVPGFYIDEVGHQAAKKRIRADASAAFDCALYAQLAPSEGAACAAKATEILSAWASTHRAVSGHDGELVMAHVGTMFVQAGELLHGHPAWKAGEEERFRTWVRDVFRPVSEIQRRTNNWAAWGVFAGLAADHYLDDRSSFRRRVARLRRILDDQIDRDGSLPREMRRGQRSLWYTYFALAPLTHATTLVRHAGGPDLREWKPGSGGSLRNAVLFFERGALDPGRWPVEVDQVPSRRGWGANLLFAAAPKSQPLEEWIRLPLRPTSSAWRRVDLLPPAP